MVQLPTLPMLASDAVQKKVKFPLMLQPKIDGVRGVNLGGGLTGRSLKQHANVYTTTLYSVSELRWLDGELAAEHECHPDLCRLTTSAVNTIAGQPFTLWHLFDYFDPAVCSNLVYKERYNLLVCWYDWLKERSPVAQNLRVVPAYTVQTWDELLEYESKWLDMGYEGVILRDPNGKHKSGRSTATEGGLLRIKRFHEEEAVVTALVEGQTNTNPAQINEVGATFRTSHQENMVPNGMVGAFTCIDVKTQKTITVSAGKMPHTDRVLYFEQPGLIVGQTIKYKTFLKGVKDKPRFPTFQSIRSPSDISK